MGVYGWMQKAPHVPWTYYVPMHTVYTGISTQVYGMAVDWLSASIYWTDALYNWITVARLVAHDVFNHIITTDLDRPMGIAVYPQNGYDARLFGRVTCPARPSVRPSVPSSVCLTRTGS